MNDEAMLGPDIIAKAVGEPLQAAPVARLLTTRPDAELAADIKARMTEKLDELVAIMNEACAAGLTVGLNMNYDQGLKRWNAQAPQIMRVY